MKNILVAMLLILSISVEAREFTQKGDSMSPTIKNGESVEVSVISSFFYEPKRWDIVLFKNPMGKKNFFIGRIVDLPNEQIILNKGGLFIDEKLINLPNKLNNSGIKYVQKNKVKSGEPEGDEKYYTEEGEYFILGDNSYNSFDSRFYGPVEREEILGKAEIE